MLKELEGYELYETDYKLVFEDHFDGDDLNPEIWHKVSEDAKGHDDTMALRRPANVTVKDSNLIITGLQEGKNFTSGKIATYNQLAFQYGYIEIYAKLPGWGRGVWPGFWTQCGDPDQDAINEIDIFEMFGTDDKIESTVHSWWKDKYNKDWIHTSYTYGNDDGVYRPADGSRVSERYMHIGMEWTPEYMTFMVDGKRHCEIRIDDDIHRIQHYPVSIIISMALGLPFLGKPDKEHTNFPVIYKVDYMRIYQNEKGKLFFGPKRAEKN